MASLNVLLVTFNCAREFVHVESLKATILRTLQQRRDAAPGLIVLCLQEVAPYAESFLGGSYLAPYFRTIESAVQKAAEHIGQRYDKLVALNVGMTAIMLLAQPHVIENVLEVRTAGVGVGDYGLGNKGAAAVRLFYRPIQSSQPSIMTFVAAHLAPFEDAWERRNTDWTNIVRGLSFESGTPVSESASEQTHLLTSGTEVTEPVGSQLFLEDASPVFLGGDLNYRTSDVGPTPADARKFPQPDQRELTCDPPKSYSFDRLKAQDQLSRERKAGKTLQGLDEMSFDFPPTYKYSAKASKTWPKDGSEPEVWHWSPHRFPSFCDRVLFSSSMSGADSPLKVHSYSALALQPTSDHRPVALSFELDLGNLRSSGLFETLQKPQIIPLDPNWRSIRLSARRKEQCVGVAAYLIMTWNGNGILLASLVGAISGWLLMKSLLPDSPV